MKTLRQVGSGVLTVSLLMLVNASGQAGEPSFDCTKAEGSVEKLICGDAQLAAFDVELARIYGLARDGKDMTETERDDLTAAQRSWITGRNACDEATDERMCVEEAYVTRIAGLREAYPAVRSADDKGISLGPFKVDCKGLDMATLFFVNADPSVAYLAWADDSHLLLTQGPSGSGARYVAKSGDGEIVFWNKGNHAMFQRPGEADVDCDITKEG